MTREVNCEEITFGEPRLDYDRRARRTPDGFSVGACPVCGESVLNMDDRFACSSGLFGVGCNLYILKDGIYDVVECNIVSELHDMFIYDDNGLAETMSDLLSWKNPRKHRYEYYLDSLYEYFEMSLVKEGDGWIVEITRDDAEAEAEAQEEYARMYSEGNY